MEEKKLYLNKTIKHYLDQLSSDAPVPGGGGTSALVGALGIGLAIMVGQIVLKKLPKPKQKRLRKTVSRLKALQRSTARVIDSDPKVYQQVMNCYKKARKARNKKAANAAIQKALARSYQAQADLAAQIAAARDFLTTIGAVAKGSIKNDLLVSSSLLNAAFQGATATARINVVYLKEGPERRKYEYELQKLENHYRKIRFQQ